MSLADQNEKLKFFILVFQFKIDNEANVEIYQRINNADRTGEDIIALHHVSVQWSDEADSAVTRPLFSHLCKFNEIISY